MIMAPTTLFVGLTAAGSSLVLIGTVVAFGWFAEIPALARLQQCSGQVSWP